MFTGIVEDIGTVVSVRPHGNYRVLSIASRLVEQDMRIGESICCDGACLTVVSFDRDSFEVEASQETLARTVAGDYRAGTRLNLERALRADSRMGGHLVTGHIDDCGTIVSILPIGESLELKIGYRSEFDRYLVAKGSIAIHGVSLTVNEAWSGGMSVNLIPHTLKATTLGVLSRGDRVNLEFDIIGKYVSRLSSSYEHNAITLEKLRESGW
ncbi:MAG: riboflavin synthase [Candidatus Zixiibacteriota bacterium]